MSFNSGIPVVTDPMIKSQKQIRANYQAINAVFAENHLPLNDDFQGRHSSMTFRVQGNPTTTAAQIALFTKIANGAPNLFFRPNSNQTPIQLTYSSISTGLASTDPDVYKTSQYSFVAGPFIIYGGILHDPTNGQFVLLTPASTLLYAFLQPVDDRGTSFANLKGASIAILSGAGFIVGTPIIPGPGTTGDYVYFAIGKP